MPPQMGRLFLAMFRMVSPTSATLLPPQATEYSNHEPKICLLPPGPHPQLEPHSISMASIAMTPYCFYSCHRPVVVVVPFRDASRKDFIQSFQS
ncbi:uncharacterized protein RAG0_03557 [Rhynchosporium agropyri]|uniref:Secreted protein n=1 Tax=Rhynchosporium agropyri TaxID=914238 RepID=A0A1E1K573_9HELO|nr:uncharacterized protein RAG0_03557 [Rhynchosporium agropyri]